MSDVEKTLEKALGKVNLAKLKAVGNPRVEAIVARYIELCKPAKVTVVTDAREDFAYVRRRALEAGEEKSLKIEGHTIHFDGPKDQGRDKAVTKYLLPPGMKLSRDINSIDREAGLREIFGLLENSMRGKEMLVLFFCLGPAGSRFAIPALQITDSFYVAHTEDILYRNGYEEFKRLGGSPDFFHFVHSAGRLVNSVSADVEKRRVYIDLEENRVFSVNTQYAGNAVGLKKLALRLAIAKASREDWLAEHMFISGVRPPGKRRVTYFAGAFPSACGKTSTAMIPGNTILGDDIAYIKKGEDGRAWGANIERGIFGIIHDVNPRDDPMIYKALTMPGEIVFSNVLVKDGVPYWQGMGRELPKDGLNYLGEWFEGKRDENGEKIPPSHKNARFAIRIDRLANADPNLDNPQGVPIVAIVYGGRDSDTSPPVLQSFNWAHGVFMGACLESETTAATLGKEGVLAYNPMANLDFIPIPLGRYIQNHLEFGQLLERPPLVFTFNYFLVGPKTR
ncbi:MAG: phosphoenolpyruvate carboxykinase (GTP), partial [Candidatus Micrarchaeia archaeon]